MSWHRTDKLTLFIALNWGIREAGYMSFIYSVINMFHYRFRLTYFWFESWCVRLMAQVL